jgi:hypothetical protein
MISPPTPMPPNETTPASDVVQALMSMNCDANLALVARTRFAVREAAILIQEQRIQRRRNVGFALAAVVVLLVLLGPAIWNSVDDLFDAEIIGGDLPSQMALLLLFLAPAMLAALVAAWNNQRDVHHQRRGF